MRTARRTTRVVEGAVALLFVAGLSGCMATSETSDRAGPGEEGAYYVATTGDDGAEGSVDAPWQDLATAINRLGPGDTLYVRAGEYHGGVEVKVSGEPGRPVTIAGYPGERPVLHAEQPYGFLLGCGIHDVVIRGFEIDDFEIDYGGGPEQHGMAHASGIMGRCDDVRTTAVSDSAFLDNVIHGNREDGEGIWLRLSPRNLVAGNVIYDLGSSGIRFKHSEGCTAFSNLVHDVGFVDGLGGGITFYCAPDTEVSFNTVVMTDAPAAPPILLYDGTNPDGCAPSDRSTVHHNLGMRFGATTEVLSHVFNVQRKNVVEARDLDLHDNLWWTAGRWRSGTSLERCPDTDEGIVPVVLWGSNIVYEGGCWLPVRSYQEFTGHGSGDLQTDPEFVDADADDYRLREGSPAMNRAEPSEREIELLDALDLGVPASGLLDLGFQFRAAP